MLFRSGRYTLLCSGVTASSATLPFDASAADFKYQLEQIPTVGIVSVVRTLGASQWWGRDRVYTVTFETFRGDAPTITADTSTLLGPFSHGTVSSVETTKGVAAGTMGTLTGLTAGANYYVKVMATNDAGVSLSTTMEQSNGRGVVPVALTASSKPDAPSAVTLNAISASQIASSWTAAHANGADLESYKVEWWTAAGTDEIKEIFIQNAGNDTAGVFSLAYGGYTTTGISTDASAATVAAALRALPSTVGEIAVSRTLTSGDIDHQWLVTFKGEAGDVGALTVVDSTRVSGVAVNINIYEDGTLNSIQGVLAANYASYEMRDRKSVV